MTSGRIWELDALRGLCLLGMVLVHLLYDLVSMGHLQATAPFLFLQEWGGVLFVFLSGICVTLGKRHLRRGCQVLACGMLCTAVTAAVWKLGYAGKDLVIWFGVLHCLGCCMLLWHPLRRLPEPALAAFGIVLTAAGLWLYGRAPVDHPWLVPLGLVYPGYASSDYFPLLPNLGYFLLGSLAGRRLYRDRQTRLPGANIQALPIRFLCGCGRHSLTIYLLHQPAFALLLSLGVFFHR